MKNAIKGFPLAGQVLIQGRETIDIGGKCAINTYKHLFYEDSH